MRKLIERLKNKEQGDDIPCLMSDLGIDYDVACTLVFTGQFDEAIKLIKELNGGHYIGHGASNTK